MKKGGLSGIGHGQRPNHCNILSNQKTISYNWKLRVCNSSARLERSTVGWEPEFGGRKAVVAVGQPWPCSMNGRPPSFKSKSVL